jgi:hypothetical protein
MLPSHHYQATQKHFQNHLAGLLVPAKILTISTWLNSLTSYTYSGIRVSKVQEIFKGNILMNYFGLVNLL